MELWTPWEGELILWIKEEYLKSVWCLWGKRKGEQEKGESAEQKKGVPYLLPDPGQTQFMSVLLT